MLELIRDLAHNKGVNLILSSHVLPDVEYTCDSRRRDGQRTRLPPPGRSRRSSSRGAASSSCASKPPGELEAFFDRLRAAGLECHATDEDVMRVFVPGDGGAHQSVRAGRRREARRCGIFAPACRRSKTSSPHAVGEATELPDPRSGLPAIRRRRGARGRAWLVIANAGVRTLLANARSSPCCCSRGFRSSSAPCSSTSPPTFRRPRSSRRTPRRSGDFFDKQDIFVFFVTVYARRRRSSPTTGGPTRCRSTCPSRSPAPSTSSASSAILMAFLLFITWVPAMLLLVVQVVFAGNFDVLQAEPVSVPGDHASSRARSRDGLARRCWRCRRCRTAAVSSASSTPR